MKALDAERFDCMLEWVYERTIDQFVKHENIPPTAYIAIPAGGEKVGLMAVNLDFSTSETKERSMMAVRKINRVENSVGIFLAAESWVAIGAPLTTIPSEDSNRKEAILVCGSTPRIQGTIIGIFERNANGYITVKEKKKLDTVKMFVFSGMWD